LAEKVFAENLRRAHGTTAQPIGARCPDSWKKITAQYGYEARLSDRIQAAFKWKVNSQGIPVGIPTKNKNEYKL